MRERKVGGSLEFSPERELQDEKERKISSEENEMIWNDNVGKF